MEQDHHPTEEVPSRSGCAQCGHPVIEEGHATPLCTDCRRAFIRFPIPKAIKVFAGVLVLVLLFAMVKVPQNLSAGVHLKRGKKAMRQSNYFTAQNEFEKVRKAVPGYTGIEEYLAIASFYNQDMKTFFEVADHLGGKKVEDEDLYGELNRLMEKSANYVPPDSFFAFFETYHSFDSIPENVYSQYVAAHPDEIFPAIRYASVLSDQERYASCDSLLNLILEKDDTHPSALLMKASVKREFKQYDSAAYYCNRMLSLNRESTDGMSAMARILLRQKKDKEGLDWALKSYEINHAEPYVVATLALAYHFNNRQSERDKLFQAAKKDSMTAEYMKYVTDIMEGREKFRD
jgi:tetratricopeptide (TPR) repeat protein